MLHEEAHAVMVEPPARADAARPARSVTAPSESSGPTRPPAAAGERAHWLLLALSLSVLALSLVLRTDSADRVAAPLLGQPLPTLCAFKRLTGLDCPGCGLTRSFISLAHGQWRAAWIYNGAGPIAFLIILFQTPYRALQIVRIRRGRPPLQGSVLGAWCLGVFASALVVQWIARAMWGTLAR